MSNIRYLGHAGFIVEHANRKLLIDPWFYPAFLQSWFPYPDNRGLLPAVQQQRFDYLYVSHAHEDHFDARFLSEFDRSVTVIAPKYRSNAMVRKFKALGYERIVALDHRESHELAPGFVVTMYLDTSHKEDSGVLLDLDGFRFLDLNDCNTSMSELPSDIDLLAAQYSGAMWYPNCYDYPVEVMAQKVKDVRDGLLDTLFRKVQLTEAKAYLPSAGPACFLDPSLEQYNDPDATIFPHWEHVETEFARRFPGLAVRAYPGDVLALEPQSRSFQLQQQAAHRGDEDLAAYRARRHDEWSAFYDQPESPITQKEIDDYFATLQQRNRKFVADFRKNFQLIAGGQVWGVRLGQLSQDFVIESEEPFDPEYTFMMSPRVLRAILDGRAGWEEALLSMRIGLHRHPDVFDLRLMGLLRYGSEPAQILQMMREQQNRETIERDGLRLQRFCPHAGEDLTHATVCNGIVECPRHHWRWNARTGECLSGGTIRLRVDVTDAAHPSLLRELVPALSEPQETSNP